MKKIFICNLLILSIVLILSFGVNAVNESIIEFQFVNSDGVIDYCTISADPSNKVPTITSKSVDGEVYMFVAWLGDDGSLYCKEQIELDYADGEPSVTYYQALYSDELEPCTKHEFIYYVTNENVTCGEYYIQTAWCENGCGATDVLNDEVLEHEYSEEYTAILPATVSRDGVAARYCINGCGECIDEIEVPAIKSVTLSQTNYVCDGKNKTPKVTVKDTDGNTLIKYDSYTTSVASNRKNVGQYAVKVTFTGLYSGSKTVYFYIRPGVTSNITTTPAEDSVTLNWDKVTGASGYRVYVYKSGSWKALKTTTSTTYTATGLTNNTKYIYAVKAYGKQNGTTYWAENYKKVTVTTLQKFDKNAITDKITFTSTKDSITLNWNKVPGATGYRVYIYLDGKWKAIYTTTANKYTLTDLGAGEKYQFSVKAYAKSGGKTIWASKFAKIYAVTAPSINGSTFMYVGGSKPFSADSLIAVTWSTSDNTIATVSSSGKVTAKKSGLVTITASFKYNGKTYKDTYTVTVKKPTITLNKTTASIEKGSTLTLKATTAPTSAKVTWKSSNTTVATVSSAGKITAKKAGAATITASFSYGGYTYSKICKVTVTNASTAQTNITKLVDYIKKYGSVNSDGNKFIKISNDTDYYYTTYAIVYDEYEDCLHFICSHEYAYYGGLNGVCAMDLNRKGTSAYFVTIFIYDDYYGDPIYTAAAEYTMPPSSYYDEYDVFDYYDENTFPDNIDISESIYLQLELAMLYWNDMIYDAIGVGLKDLGFTNYNY